MFVNLHAFLREQIYKRSYVKLISLISLGVGIVKNLANKKIQN